MIKYEIYTDGAASNNGCKNAIGGYAYAIWKDGELIKYGHGCEKGATNQQMELTAIIKGLKAAEQLSKLNFEETEMVVYTDSAYCQRCYAENWYMNWLWNGWLTNSKKPVANKELWEQLIPFFTRTDVSLVKVKGHAHDKKNELVDQMAVNARLSENVCEVEWEA